MLAWMTSANSVFNHDFHVRLCFGELEEKICVVFDHRQIENLIHSAVKQVVVTSYYRTNESFCVDSLLV